MRNLLKRLYWCLLLVLFLSFQYLPAQNFKYAEKIKCIEDFVKKQIKVDRIPGLSIGFIKDDFIWARDLDMQTLRIKSQQQKKQLIDSHPIQSQ